MNDIVLCLLINLIITNVAVIIHICYFPAGRSVLRKTVPGILNLGSFSLHAVYSNVKYLQMHNLSPELLHQIRKQCLQIKRKFILLCCFLTVSLWSLESRRR